MTDTNRQKTAAGNEKMNGLDRTKRAFSNLGDRVQSGELKARMQYFLFRQSQQAMRSDSLFSKYKRRLKDDWRKWLGIAAGITGIIMLFSPERFWLWQIPLVFILMFIAPAFFELPNTLNALFGHSEHQHLVGSIITLTHPIVNSQGSTLLENREWVVSGQDCPAGSTVKIITLDARTLYVAPANSDMPRRLQG